MEYVGLKERMELNITFEKVISFTVSWWVGSYWFINGYI